MNDPVFHGLRWRFLALALSTVVLTALGVGAFGIQSQAAAQHRALENHGQRLASILAQNAEYALYTRDQAAATQLLSSVDVDETIDFAAVLDPGLEALHRHARPGAPARLPELAGSLGPGGDSAWISADGGRWYDVVVPVWSKPGAIDGEAAAAPVRLGYVRLLVSDRTVWAQTRWAAGSMLLAAAVVVALGAAISIVVSRRVVGPIGDLVAATARIGEGDLSPVRVPPQHDEVSALAVAFNEMLRRLAESRAEVESYQDTLEQRVEERTEQLQRATEEAQDLAKQAAAAAEAKMRFLANMSHEIRTPMNSVLGLSDLLRRARLGPSEMELATTIHASAKGLLALLSDILDLAKAEAGQIHLEQVPVHVPSLVGSALSVVERDASQKGLRITSEVDDRLAWVGGDETRLRQILLNLLSNAVKFTQRGAVGIRVEQVAVEGDELTLRFEVRDTGIGIAAAERDRVFAPFVQADESTTRRFGGTGLGLAICRQLVEKMDGDIGIDSAVGRGTTVWFVVRLPRTDAPIEDVEEVRRAPGRARHVLVVEDNAFNQVVARRILAFLGHTVDIAPSGLDAIARVKEVWYDIVFMDCQMPGMDGYEATREIRALERKVGSQRVPIIALTAHAMPEDRERALAAGMDGYVTKPFTHQHIAAAIAEHARVATPPVSDRRDPDVLPRSLVDVFASSARDLIAQIALAVRAGDADRLALASHTLKGAAAQAGAVALSAAARAIEGVARTGSVEVPEDDLEQLPALLSDAVKALVGEAGDDEAPPDDAPAPTVRGKRPLVLIVDDDPVVRGVLRDVLSPTFDVEEASDGTSALERAAELTPALVLLDIVMPGPNGLETCARLRELPSFGACPIVMLTGADDLASIDRAYQAGATDYFTKPVRGRVLLQRAWNIVHAAEAVKEAEQRRIAAEEERKANAAKSAFLASMSHELRTPLNAIIGYAEMIAEECEQGAPSVAADARRVSTAGAHLLGLLNDVLDLAKVQAGRLVLVRERFEVRPRFDPQGDGTARGWIAAIAHRHLVDRHRRRRARGVVVELGELPSFDPSVDERLARRQQVARLEAALTRLPEAHRRVVVAHHVGGLPLDAIAAAEGVPEGTVKSRLHRARARLAALLGGGR